MISKELNPQKYFQLWLCYDTLEDFEKEESWVNQFRSYSKAEPVQVECNCYVKTMKQKKVIPYVDSVLINIAANKYGAERVCVMAYDEQGELVRAETKEVSTAKREYENKEGINSLLEQYERCEKIMNILLEHGADPELARMWAPALDIACDTESLRWDMMNVLNHQSCQAEELEKITEEMGL